MVLFVVDILTSRKACVSSVYEPERIFEVIVEHGGLGELGVLATRARVREAQRANENASYDEELASLMSTNKTAGTRRRAVAELESEARRRARKRLPYVDFVQTCLFHGLAAREDALAPVAETLAGLPGVLSVGVMSEAQFAETCARTRPAGWRGEPATCASGALRTTATSGSAARQRRPATHSIEPKSGTGTSSAGSRRSSRS